MPDYLEWPKLRWWWNAWLSTIQTAVTFAVFFFPGFSTQNEPWHSLRLFVGVPLVLLPFGGPLVSWLARAMFVTGRRLRSYRPLYQKARLTSAELAEMRATTVRLLERVTGLVPLSISRAYFDVHTDKMYIVIEKARSPKLQERMVISAWRLSDKDFMGVFIITRVLQNEYVACEYTSVDALWKGHVRGCGETNTVPDIVAAYLPGGTTT